MAVTGNKPPPYGREGTAQCIANIRRDCAKLKAIIGERKTTPERGRALLMIEIIEEYVGDVETSGEERE